MYIFNLYITWFKSIKSGYYQDKEMKENKNKHNSSPH